MAIPSTEELDRMPEEELLEVLSAYGAAYHRRAKGELLRLVREQLAEPGLLEPGQVPIKVVFDSREYENGWYFSEGSARVYVQVQREPEVIDFEADEVEELLATLSEWAGKQTELIVDLVTGAVEQKG